jgi:hypothetical protein
VVEQLRGQSGVLTLQKLAVDSFEKQEYLLFSALTDQGQSLDQETCEKLMDGVHAIAKPRQLAGVTVHRVLMADDKTMWLCFETYTEALKEEILKAMPAQVVMLNSCFVGTKADEQLANLQLELTGLDIALIVIRGALYDTNYEAPVQPSRLPNQSC